MHPVTNPAPNPAAQSMDWAAFQASNPAAAASILAQAQAAAGQPQPAAPAPQATYTYEQVALMLENATLRASQGRPVQTVPSPAHSQTDVSAVLRQNEMLVAMARENAENANRQLQAAQSGQVAVGQNVASLAKTMQDAKDEESIWKNKYVLVAVGAIIGVAFFFAGRWVWQQLNSTEG